MTYTNHSGGCPGADMTWENEGNRYGITTIAYSFHNHVQDGKNQKVLTLDELAEGWKNIEIAGKTLKRPLGGLMPYVRNLLARNWFQVKGGHAIFAIGTFADQKRTQVSGGTGWAVQMAVDNRKPVFFFDQKSNKWHSFDYEFGWFTGLNGLPILTEHFAGIGTRDISPEGIQAIKDVLTHQFGESHAGNIK